MRVGHRRGAACRSTTSPATRCCSDPALLHPLERLTEHLGGPQIWAKREDCNSGLAYGGNKTRKLEYIVPDVLASGADTLVSIGGYQSNHTRQVAAVAARLGLKARLVQERWVDWPDAVNDKVGNILLSRIMGADVHLEPSGFGIEIKSSWQAALDEVEAQGGRPYPIPAGASEHPLGGLGFANWALRGGAAGVRAGRLLRHGGRVQRDRVDPGRDDRRLRRPGSASSRHRHRRLGKAQRQPATRSSASPDTPPSKSVSAASFATRRSPFSRGGQATATAYP